MATDHESLAANHSFTFMLDGIGDPSTAKGITRDLKEREGLLSRADPAGMWLEVESDEPIDEAFSDRVVAIARLHGIEPRDRVGSSFVANVSREALRKKLAFEWTSRFATAVVFLLPAIALHYLKPILAGATNYVPNGIEAILVGWAIIAAAWPTIYQGLVSLASFRMTPDLFQSAIIAVSFLAGLIQTIFDHEQTTFHATAFAVLLIAMQRMIIWRSASRLDGWAHRMLPTSRFLLIILAASTLMCVADLRGGLAMMLAVPAMLGALSINRLGHPTMWVIPILMFVALLAFSPLVLAVTMTSQRIEAAALFNGMICSVTGFALGSREHQ